MPELPEVETVRKGLIRLVGHKTIADVTILWPKIVTNAPDDFKKQLIGKTIQTVDRRGKYLLFRLSGDRTLLCFFIFVVI